LWICEWLYRLQYRNRMKQICFIQTVWNRIRNRELINDFEHACCLINSFDINSFDVKDVSAFSRTEQVWQCETVRELLASLKPRAGFIWWGAWGPAPGKGLPTPHPPKKIPEKYFSSGKRNVKFGHISGKYWVKFEHIVNFSYIRGKNALFPPKLTVLLRLYGPYLESLYRWSTVNFLGLKYKTIASKNMHCCVLVV